MNQKLDEQFSEKIKFLSRVNTSDLNKYTIYANACNHFRKKTNFIELRKVNNLGIDVSDYNNDGELDVLLSGWGGSASYLWWHATTLSQLIVFLEQFYNKKNINFDIITEDIAEATETRNDFCIEDGETSCPSLPGYQLHSVRNSSGKFLTVFSDGIKVKEIIEHVNGAPIDICSDAEIEYNSQELIWVNGDYENCKPFLTLDVIREIREIDAANLLKSDIVHQNKDINLINEYLNKVGIDEDLRLETYYVITDFYRMKSLNATLIKYASPSRGGYMLNSVYIIRDGKVKRFSSYSEAFRVNVFTYNNEKFIYVFDDYRNIDEEPLEHHLVFEFDSLFSHESIPVCSWEIHDH
jgi:hypothetical protein